MTKKSKSIWVIEQGSYSDYRVVGVFSSKENAEVVASKMEQGYDAPTISEWSIDPMVDEINSGRKQYLVHMLINGNVGHIQLRDFEAEGTNHFIWRRSTAPAYQGQNVPDVLVSCVWAKDEKHAIKIANERRVQLIASGEWK